MRLAWTASDGATGYITMKEAGTNFGARLTSEQVLKAFAEAKRVGQRLPFDIMAAGYGQDEDWVGLDPDDWSGFAFGFGIDRLRLERHFSKGFP